MEQYTSMGTMEDPSKNGSSIRLLLEVISLSEYKKILVTLLPL